MATLSYQKTYRVWKRSKTSGEPNFIICMDLGHGRVFGAVFPANNSSSSLGDLVCRKRGSSTILGRCLTAFYSQRVVRDIPGIYVNPKTLDSREVLECKGPVNIGHFQKNQKREPSISDWTGEEKSRRYLNCDLSTSTENALQHKPRTVLRAEFDAVPAKLCAFKELEAR